MRSELLERDEWDCLHLNRERKKELKVKDRDDAQRAKSEEGSKGDLARNARIEIGSLGLG